MLRESFAGSIGIPGSLKSCAPSVSPGGWNRVPPKAAPRRKICASRASWCNFERSSLRISKIIEEISRLSTLTSNMVPTDAMLVSAIGSGDEHAMAQLYDRYSGVVYSVALRVLNDRGAAEDILQDVFMQLWRNPGVFDASRGSLPGWLAVIARNRAIDSCRKRRPETEISDVVVSVSPDLAGQAEWNRSIEKVRGAIENMPSAQRSALEMAFFEGLTHSEIAAKTGEPLGTIKTRIRAGLVSLRKVFNP